MSSAPPTPRRAELLPIRTLQSNAPWLWRVLINLHWATSQYIELICGTAIVFKLRPLVSSPGWIPAITSFNVIFNVLVGCTINYVSDRIWTRWGRRSPFIIAGQLVTAVGLALLPGLHTLALVVLWLFFYDMLRDVNSPIEALINEVVPPHQRGSADAIGRICRALSSAFFFGVMVAQYDHRYQLPGGLTLTGEELMCWLGAVFGLYTAVLLLFFVRETPPASPAPRAMWPGIGPALRKYFRDVFAERQFRAIYLVGLTMTIFWLGLGSFGPLLAIEQFHYSKADFGFVTAVSSPFTIFIVLPLGGWLADRVDRITIFKCGAIATATVHLCFYVYARFLAPGGVPPLAVLIGFHLVTSSVGSVSAIASTPMLFDFIPRDRIGTVNSGIGMVRGAAVVLITNGVAVFVSFWSGWFEPPGKYDYLSGYLYLSFAATLGTLVALWFERQVKAGRFVRYGRGEVAAKT